MQAALLMGLVNCGGTSEGELREVLEQSSACDVATQCVEVIGPCPFGCGVAVNQSSLAEVQNAFEDYDPGTNCFVRCPGGDKQLTCEAGRCTIVYTAFD